VDALLDTAPRGIAERIAAATLAVEAVRRVIQKRVRGSGNQLFVELHVAVPRHLSFEESHAVTHEVKDAVRTVAPEADVVVHTVPVAEEEGVLDLIQAVAERGHFAVHNITTHQTRKGTWVDLDLEVPPDLSLERAHALAINLETRLRAELEAYVQRSPTGPNKVADVNIHIEPRAEELIPGVDLAPEVREHYVRRIDAIRVGIPHARECYDVDVQQLAGGVYLAFHLRLDAELSITEVHSVTEELENRLRRELPGLGRVVIHAEPYAADDAQVRDDRERGG
jgi:divalent metal cation (Fe/Co/Zn/Cd) transporter